MATTFALLFAITFFALFVLIPIAIFSKKKNPDKSKKFFKYTKISATITIVSFILFGIFDDTEPTNDSEKSETTKPVEKETTGEKATHEAKEKAEAEQKAKEESVAAQKAKEKAEAKSNKAAEKLAAEKEYYLKEIKTKVDIQMGMYDAAWSEIWQPTFEGISNSTVDVYTAYSNMKIVEQRYDTLYTSIGAIKNDSLSKENAKLFEDFKTSMKNAALMRKEAAKKARKMFDKGDYSPSKFDKVKSDVTYADNEMMQAVIALTSLENKLGVERNQ